MTDFPSFDKEANNLTGHLSGTVARGLQFSHNRVTEIGGKESISNTEMGEESSVLYKNLLRIDFSSRFVCYESNRNLLSF